MADQIPTQITQYQTGFAPEIAPYGQALLGSAMGSVFQTETDPATGMPKVTGFNPYMQYQGDRFAQFSPLQQQAFTGAQGMQSAPQLEQASALAGQAGLGALGYGQYSPSQFNNFYNPTSSYQPTSFTAQQVNPQSLSNYQMAPAERVSAQQVGTPLMSAAQTSYAPNLQTYQMGPVSSLRTKSFIQPGAASAYMSPYMQNVVDVQQQRAQREADIQGQAIGAQFAQAGAFGGGRQAVQQGRAAEALARQKQDIQASGLQSAFQQAQQQFNVEQGANLQAQQANQQAQLARQQANLQSALGVQQLGAQMGLQTSLANLSSEQQANVQNQAAQLQAQGMNAQQAMQAALANQQAGLATGQQNLAALLGVQQLGSGQSMQAALANQQAQQQAQQQAEQSRQYGYSQLMQQAGLGAQYGQSAAQLGEQSRQYGAGLGLQGLQTALQGAQQLGALGQTQFGQQQSINQLQGQYGQQQQQQMQNILSAQYQDFLNAQNNPYKQLGFFSDILRGAPLTQTGAAMYQAPPSTLATVAGLGSIAKGTGMLGGKKGGLTKDFERKSGKPAGLNELALQNMGRAA